MAAGEVLEGAGSGAVTGAALTGGNPWGVAIGAAVGAIGGFLGSSSSRKANRRQASLQRRAQRMLRPEQILKVATKVTPKFRALVAGGVGPGIEGRVAANLARSGLTDTGVGEALRTMSFSLPGVIASRGALDFAQQAQAARANALLGAAAIPPTPSGVLAALAGGLQGGLGTFLAMQQRADSIGDLRRIYPDLIPGNAPAPTFPKLPDAFAPNPSYPPPPTYRPPSGPLF